MEWKLRIFSALKLDVSEPSALLTEPSITADKLRGTTPEMMKPTRRNSRLSEVSLIVYRHKSPCQQDGR
jgi:hypothetical protein